MNYVTGSNGFIGSRLCELIKGDTVGLRRNQIFTPYEPYSFFHLAAYGNHHHQKDVIETVHANVSDLIELTALKDTDLIRFYNVSTSAVHFATDTPYILTKKLGEQIINSLDSRFINVRPYSVYGPGEAPHRFIPTVIRCLKSGEQMNLDTESCHDWIYVDDFIYSLIESKEKVTEIGTGISTSNIEVVRMLEEISGKKLNFVLSKKMREYDRLDWVCPTPVQARTLYEGLKQTYDATR